MITVPAGNGEADRQEEGSQFQALIMALMEIYFLPAFPRTAVFQREGTSLTIFVQTFQKVQKKIGS